MRYREIASEVVGRDDAAALKMVSRDFSREMKALAEREYRNREALRDFMLAQMDSLLEVWVPVALARDPVAYGLVQKGWTLKCRLMGLDAPERLNVTEHVESGSGTSEIRFVHVNPVVEISSPADSNSV